MGRNILPSDSLNNPPPAHNTFISLTLFIACAASTIALVSFLCGALSRRKNTKTENDSEEAISPANEATTGQANDSSARGGNDEYVNNEQNEQEGPPQPLPPPPAMGHLRAASCHQRSSSNVMPVKLPSSMSMRVTGSADKEHHGKKKDKKLSHEDSIWKKTIILGEKCKPQEDDDTVVYDEKGNRISTYHPKTSSTLSISRQNSRIDQSAVPL